MTAEDIHYRRNLPHYHPQGNPLFITFRLAGSLPLQVLAQLQTQRKLDLAAVKDTGREARDEIEEKYFERYDDYLDRHKTGPHWLQGENIAEIVIKETHIMDGSRYLLMAYCIMPNHVHLLIKSLIKESASHRGRSAKYPVAETLRLLKGRTARNCNLELKRNGSFWQHESYDHVVRDEKELERIILYILNNPVKAGLVKEWKAWPFTYISPELGKWS